MKCHGRLFGVIAILTLVSGCAKEHKGWSSFPVTIYADPALIADGEAHADLNDAMSFWEAKAGQKLFNYKGAWKGQSPPYTGTASAPGTILGNVVFLQNPWPLAQNIAGLTTITRSDEGIQASMIMMNPEIPFCTGSCTNDNESPGQRIAFAHELGHFLGLEHVKDEKNVMYPTVLPGGRLTDIQVDETALKDLIEL